MYTVLHKILVRFLVNFGDLANLVQITKLKSRTHTYGAKNSDHQI